MKLNYTLLFIVTTLMFSCFRKTPLPNQPKVGLVERSFFSAKLAASFSGINIIDRGICWSESQNPNLNGNFQSAGGGASSVEMTITNLTPQTTYFVRSYVTNEAGTVYSNNVTFTTSTAFPLTTEAPSSVGSTSASIGVVVGGSSTLTIQEQGVCWGTSPKPIVSNNSAQSSVSTTNYTVNLQNLTPNTTYYARAYMKILDGYLYGSEISFRTLGEVVTDRQGNKYNTITIGSQTWMLENLLVTVYNNGDAIPGVVNSNWSVANDAYGYLYNSVTNQIKYGNIYNYQTLTDTRKLAPEGWRIPSQADWDLLVNYLGTNLAAKKLASSLFNEWGLNDYATLNESKFNALAGGFRDNIGNEYNSPKQILFWSSTPSNNNEAISFRLINNSGFLSHDLAPVNRKFGCYVRCIKNN